MTGATPRGFAALVPLVLAAAVLAACGNDDAETTAEGPTPEASATTEATPRPTATRGASPPPTSTPAPKPTQTPEGRAPAFVDEAAVADGVLTVTGDLPTPCHVVDHEVLVEPSGRVEVSVFSHPPGPDEACAAVLSPFELLVDVPPDGDPCAVVVNGEPVESDARGCTDSEGTPR